jgi:putative ABC transport system ATP-binding protein
MALIELKQLTHAFQDGEHIRTILKDISLTFEAGTFYTILGPSGSGKTTLLSLLAALDEPSSGQIVFKGNDIKKIGLEAYRRNAISIVFQAYNLVPYMTAVENVQIPMAITDNQIPKDSVGVAYNLLDYIGITRSKADRIVNTLSGGEQQRVAIARALASNVDVLLADEPTGNLDERLEDEMIEIFKDLAHHHTKCIIMVTHNPRIAKASDHAYTIKEGVLVPYE